MDASLDVARSAVVVPRRSTAVVHNPLLALPAAQRLAALPREQREIMRDLLMELSGNAKTLADASWRKNKGPMAAYWKAVAVYAKHAGRVLGRGGR